MLHKSSHALKEPTLMLHMSSHAEMSLYKHSISTWCTRENLIYTRILFFKQDTYPVFILGMQNA